MSPSRALGFRDAIVAHLAPNVLYVVYEDGAWRLRRDSALSKPCPGRDEAVHAAVREAKGISAKGLEARVLAHNEQGGWEMVWDSRHAARAS